MGTSKNTRVAALVALSLLLLIIAGQQFLSSTVDPLGGPISNAEGGPVTASGPPALAPSGQGPNLAPVSTDGNPGTRTAAPMADGAGPYIRALTTDGTAIVGLRLYTDRTQYRALHDRETKQVYQYLGTTDHDGRVKLPSTTPLPTYIAAPRSDYFPLGNTLLVDHGARDVLVYFGRGLTIQGRVTLEGASAESARVTLLRNPEFPIGEHRQSGSTSFFSPSNLMSVACEAGGDFKVTGVPETAKYLEVFAKGAIPKTVELDLSVDRGTFDLGTIDLARGNSLQIKVTSAQTESLAGSRFCIRRKDRGLNHGTSGRVLDDSNVCRFEGLQPGAFFYWIESEDVYGIAGQFELGPGQRNLEVGIPASQDLELAAVDQDGNSLKRWMVRVGVKGVGTREIPVEGSWRARVSTSSYLKLRASAEGFEDSARIRVKAGTASYQAQLTRHGRLHVRCLNGLPTDLTFGLLPLGDPSYLLAFEHGVLPVPFAKPGRPIDHDTFEVEGVAAGSYRLLLRTGGVVTEQGDVTLAPGKTSLLTAELSPSRILAGTVVDGATGAPIEGVAVTLRSGPGITASFASLLQQLASPVADHYVTDSTGAFSMAVASDLEGAELFLHHSGYADLSVPVGHSSGSLQIRMEPRTEHFTRLTLAGNELEGPLELIYLDQRLLGAAGESTARGLMLSSEWRAGLSLRLTCQMPGVSRSKLSVNLQAPALEEIGEVWEVLDEWGSLRVGLGLASLGQTLDLRAADSPHEGKGSEGAQVQTVSLDLAEIGALHGDVALSPGRYSIAIDGRVRGFVSIAAGEAAEFEGLEETFSIAVHVGGGEGSATLTARGVGETAGVLLTESLDLGDGPVEFFVPAGEYTIELRTRVDPPSLGRGQSETKTAKVSPASPAVTVDFDLQGSESVTFRVVSTEQLRVGRGRLVLKRKDPSGAAPRSRVHVPVSPAGLGAARLAPGEYVGVVTVNGAAPSLVQFSVIGAADGESVEVPVGGGASLTLLGVAPFNSQNSSIDLIPNDWDGDPAFVGVIAQSVQGQLQRQMQAAVGDSVIVDHIPEGDYVLRVQRDGEPTRYQEVSVRSSREVVKVAQ